MSKQSFSRAAALVAALAGSSTPAQNTQPLDGLIAPGTSVRASVEAPPESEALQETRVLSQRAVNELVSEAAEALEPFGLDRFVPDLSNTDSRAAAVETLEGFYEPRLRGQLRTLSELRINHLRDELGENEIEAAQELLHLRYLLERTTRIYDPVEVAFSLTNREMLVQGAVPELVIEQERVASGEGEPIIFIRQVHNQRALFDEDTGEIIDQPQLRRMVATYQADIVRYLQDIDATHVFDEGQYQRFTSQDEDRGPLFRDIRRQFPAGNIPHHLSPQQVITLLAYNAATVHAALSSDVTVHPTVTEAESRELNRRAAEEGDDYVYRVREGFAMREIMNFLGENEDARPVLIFGAAHHFDHNDLPENTERPPIEAVTLPRALALDPSRDLSVELLSATEDPEAELLLVRSALSISVDGFEQIDTSEAQLAAVPQLVLSQQEFHERFRSNPRHLLEHLLNHAVDEQAAAALRSAFEEKRFLFNPARYRAESSAHR